MESKFDEKLFAGKEPLEIFRRWFEEAKKTEINDPDAIALATVDEEGLPNVRMVFRLFRMMDLYSLLIMVQKSKRSIPIEQSSF